MITKKLLNTAVTSSIKKFDKWIADGKNRDFQPTIEIYENGVRTYLNCDGCDDIFEIDINLRRFKHTLGNLQYKYSLDLFERNTKQITHRLYEELKRIETFKNVLQF